MESHGGGFRLAVLNPGGRDAEQDFAAAPRGDGAAHAPVNFHAYAACTGGCFYRDTARATEAKRPVLLLLRGDFRDSERALGLLKKAGQKVAVSLKETGLHQIANQLGDRTRLSRFLRIVTEADGCLAPTPEAADVYRSVLSAHNAVAFIPTPYPLHDSRWDVSRPPEERRGIFIGTREWDVPSRNHLAALLAARRISEATGEPITVFNCDGRRGEGLLAQLGLGGDRLRVLDGALPYEEYMAIVAQHKIVFQLDTSFVPGQVAGDALLCRLPCVGGNGAIERAAFRELCGAEKSIGELIEIGIEVLRDAAFYERAIGASQERAGSDLSFPVGALQLEDFFSAL